MKKNIVLYILFFWSGWYIYAQNTYVFLGSFNQDKTTEGIYVYKLDTLTGKLIKVSSVKNIHNPSYLTLSPNGKFLYACTESKTPGAGSVSSFRFDAKQGTLTYINSQESLGENPVYVTVHKNGKWLVNANYTESSITLYSLAEDGSIGEARQHFEYTEGSIHPERQERSHIHAAVFSPDQQYIFLPDLGADKIRSYRFDTILERPFQIGTDSFARTVPGSGPRHLTFHPNGNFAYCIEELSGTISVFGYSQGQLDSLQRIAAHPLTATGDFESSDIHISPDGKFLYASNRGRENNIAIFRIQEDGTLKRVGYQSTQGNHPRIFAIDAGGKFLIVGNVVSGDVVVFKRNPNTGLLKPTGEKLEIRNVSCVQIRSYK